MDFPEIVLKPVGFVRSEIKEPGLKSGKDGITLQEKISNVKIEHAKIKNLISEIVIDPSLSELLDDIDGYSHIVILFWAHKCTAREPEN